MTFRGGELTVIGANEVRRLLSYRACIPIVRQAMMALSSGRTRQLLRSFLPLGDAKTFAIMPASFQDCSVFGAKLVSVYGDAVKTGRKRHRGIVALFDDVTGAPAAIVDAEEITRIRTAAASAAATDALARRGAARLAILGCGAQAEAHIHALACVRELREVAVWGRDFDRASSFASRMHRETGSQIRPCRTVSEATDEADIVCTLTGAKEPVLALGDVAPRTHINAVGSSGPGPVEIAADLVREALFVADHRESVAAHGAELLAAQRAGLAGDSHIAAEIGEVFAGAHPGRADDSEITLYKSLGHAVQDVAAAAFVFQNF